MAVKFKIAHTHGSLYVPGDIAKFDAKTEQDLVKREIAEKHQDAGKPADGAQ